LSKVEIRTRTEQTTRFRNIDLNTVLKITCTEAAALGSSVTTLDSSVSTLRTAVTAGRPTVAALGCSIAALSTTSVAALAAVAALATTVAAVTAPVTTTIATTIATSISSLAVATCAKKKCITLPFPYFRNQNLKKNMQMIRYLAVAGTIETGGRDYQSYIDQLM
jgi:hypothetical protein